MTPDAEPDRVARVFGAYARDPAKRRAWSAENPGNAAIRQELTAALLAAGALPGRDGEVLDVGCGQGWWLRRLADEGVAPARLHGIDVLPERVRAARRTVPGARVEVGDARALPFDAGRFALVTLLVTLSSLSDERAIRAALAEGRRVLGPGGLLAIWDLRWPSPNPAVTRLRPAVVRAGLGDVEMRSITLLPPVARRLGGATARLYPRLAALAPLRSHRLVLVRRDGERPSVPSAVTVE